MVFAVRGAIQVHSDSAELIAGASVKLVKEICRRNALTQADLVSIVFSITRDLTAANPATALRREGYAETPLFCVQEAEVEGGMPRVIRALLTVDPLGAGDGRGAESRRRAAHVYLDGAEALRPDLA